MHKITNKRGTRKRPENRQKENPEWKEEEDYTEQTVYKTIINIWTVRCYRLNFEFISVLFIYVYTCSHLPLLYRGECGMTSLYAVVFMYSILPNIKDSTAGVEGVRMIAIKYLRSKTQQQLFKSVLRLRNTLASKWPDEVKEGLIVPLHKKGKEDNLDNYREVCLLPMAYRVIAKVFATRLMAWSNETEIPKHRESSARTILRREGQAKRSLT